MFCELKCCTRGSDECQEEPTCVNCWPSSNCLQCFCQPTEEPHPDCTCCKCQFSPKPDCQNCECECVEDPVCLGCYCPLFIDPFCYCVKVRRTCSPCCSSACLRSPTISIPRSWEMFDRGIPVLDNDKAIVQQLTCPLCKQFYSRPYMLPCEHCLCKTCVDNFKTQTRASTETYLLIVCPVCNCSHYFPEIDTTLPENYLRATVLRKYCVNRGICLPRAGIDPYIIYCQHCPMRQRREAVMKCTTCRKQFYCNRCLWKYHSNRMLAYHNITEYIQREELANHCFHHPTKLITEYCFTDKALLCEDCKLSNHEDHNTLPLSKACAEEARALFCAIAKFRRVKYGLETDLLEMNLLRSNFKINKENRKKEIRSGFRNLFAILNEHERNILESIENMENDRQQRIVEFLKKSVPIAYNAEGLMQYAKEALKEESQIAFLQSANALVKEIDDEVSGIYQPDACLKQDPITNLRFNFEQISSSLQILFPRPITKTSHINETQTEPKYLYVSASGEDIIVPKTTPSGQLMPCKSRTSCKVLDIVVCPTNMVKDENNGRAKSLPPITLPRSDACRFWQEYPLSVDIVKDRDYEICPVVPSSSQQITTRPSSVPGRVTIYQTVAFPTAAKVFWNPPEEEVDYYDAEFQEILDDKSEDCAFGDFTGKMYGIRQDCMELHNLRPRGEYLFRVRAVNSAGKSDWSELLKIITPPVTEAQAKQNNLKYEQHKCEKPFLDRIRNVFIGFRSTEESHSMVAETSGSVTSMENDRKRNVLVGFRSPEESQSMVAEAWVPDTMAENELEN